MRTTGIVRRLDELGRIVIPREYRRLYSINIGDPLEIVAMENGDIVISKVSTESDLVALGRSACESLASEFGLTAAVSNLKEYTTGAGGGKSAVIGKELTIDLSKQIKDRRSGICSGISYGFSYMAYAPIFGTSDVFGGIFLFGGVQPDESKLASLKIAGKLIGDSLQKF
ncbi:MAG: AbrB/MazE/SpoVT family DNA-binding domain-containing protein [Clostridiales bacterium]|nr:AbrB/MazE/SpoVT family DNA-binding domain-containing protein [Clostridiales bacterium]